MKQHLTYITLYLLLSPFLSSAQISISVGASHRFRSDLKFDNDGNSWYGGLKQSEIKEHIFVDNQTVGIDYAKGDFNFLADFSISTNKLLINSSSSISHGSSSGSSTSTTAHQYSINYGYLGLRLSPQKVYQISKNMDLRSGFLLEGQTRIFEREYDHHSYYRYHSFHYNPWTQVSNSYSSETVSKSEYNGMDLEKFAALIGATLHPTFHYKKCDFILNLSGGIGSTFRRDLAMKPTIWDEKIYFWGELGIRVAYQLGTT